MMKILSLFRAAPIFENEDKTTEAQLTHVILIVLLGIVFVTGLTPFFFRDKVLSNDVFYLVIFISIGLIIGMFTLLYRGYVRLTNWVLISLYWIVITSLSLATGGIRSQAFFGYFVAIALAGLLLGGRASLGTTFFCVSAATLMLYLGENQLLPSLSMLPSLSTTWFSASAYLIILAVLQNLTAKTLRKTIWRARMSEKQNRDQRDFALQVMNTIGQGLTITGPNGLEYVNPAFVQMIGYPVDELLGKKPAEFTFPDDYPILEEARSQRLAGKTNTYETRLRSADGKIIRTLVTAVPRWQDGNVIGAIAIVTDLTERIHMEEALRASEALYRQAIEAADAVPYRLDHRPDSYEKPYSFMGDGIHQMTGYTPQEMTPKVWDSLILESSLRGEAANLPVQEAVRRAREGKMPIWQCDYRISTRNGDVRWIADTAIEILNAQGASDGSIGIMQDITDRKQAQETLEREHYLLRMVIDYLPDYIYFKDREHRCLVSNVANALALGTTPEELVGKTLADYYPLDEAEKYNAIDQQIFATGKTIVNQENTFFDTTTHSHRWTLMSRIPFRATDGTVVGVIGISHDITERKLVELALAEQAEETKMLYQVSGKLANAAVKLDDLAYQIAKIVVEDLKLAECGVWLVDDDRSVLRRIAYEGYAHDYTPFDIPLNGPGLMTTAIQTGELIYAPDVRIDPRYLAGDSKTLSEMVVPLRIQDRIIGILNIENPEVDAIQPRQQRVMSAFAERAALALENARLVESLETAVAEVQQWNFILEERVAERTETLQHRTTQLEEANKELEAFSYSVSHDLRAPLRAIDGFSTILAENYAEQLPPDAQHYLQRVSESAKRMNQLVNDLLAFSRLTRKELNKQQVQPFFLVNEVLEELQREQIGREIEWVIHDLPECHADPSLLRQVYANLIGNALKFTRQKPQAQIEIGSQIENGEIIYFVRDNGAGFDMQYANKLFGVFQRLHTSDEFEGTGIGLANVKRIVTRHGGRIWAKADINQGANFYFTLPKAENLT